MSDDPIYTFGDLNARNSYKLKIQVLKSVIKMNQSRSGSGQPL